MKRVEKKVQVVDLRKVVDEYVELANLIKQLEKKKNELSQQIKSLGILGELEGYSYRIRVMKVETLIYDPRALFELIGEKIFDVVKVQNTKLRLVEDVVSGRELEKCVIGVDEVLRITIEK